MTLKVHDTITEGDAVGVLLSNRPDRVWLDRADYDRIVAAHGYRAWTWLKALRYVRVRPAKGKDVPVARLVLESDNTGFVHFADGDRLNLRRKNLSVRSYLEQGRVTKPRSQWGWGKARKSNPSEAGKRPPSQFHPIPVVQAVKRPRPVHR